MTSSPDCAATMLVGAIVTASEGTEWKVCRSFLRDFWEAVYGEYWEDMPLNVSLDEVNTRTEILRRTRSASMNDIFRLFDVEFPPHLPKEKIEAGEQQEAIEGVEEFIAEMEVVVANHEQWLVEREAARQLWLLQRKARPRRKKDREQKRRRHERSKQKKLLRKRLRQQKGKR